ncbi:unnamed protein product [Staurois parvus]|uniref:Uncharacterized protein n=1 Tax=Staurois parvus TaxID=386267 RepID=A0ABN9BD20_9NEOB|nr:unnamed protein product [Staurois parvus]
MTRDCGHSTGDDQRLLTFREGGAVTQILTGIRSHFIPSLSSGTHDRSQKTAGPFTKCNASCACEVGTRL